MSESIVLKIDGKQLEHWQNLQLTFDLDGFSTVGFQSPWEYERDGFRDLFAPFKYKEITVESNGELLFTGTLLDTLPSVDPTARTIMLSGYSLPGVLQDVTPYALSFNHLEFGGMKLKDITNQILKLFPITLAPSLFDEGARFEVAKCEKDQRIFDFLMGLAKQRQLIISDNEKGELVYTQEAIAGVPVARFVEGEAPTVMITPSFNPQEYYSEVTGIGTAKIGGSGSKYTEENLALRGAPRPITFTVDDTEAGDLPTATKAYMGRMLANAASYTIQDIPGWRNLLGGIWKKGERVNIYSPHNFVFSEYTFTVRSVMLLATENALTASLSVTIPGSFLGQIPTTLPWD